MNQHERMRRKASVGTEFLESRQLLNAHFAQPSSVHIEAHRAAPITGTLSGTSSYTEDASNADLGGDTYSVSGHSSLGMASLTATDRYSSTQINPRTYQDQYSNGSLTLTLGDGSTVAVSYAGSGHSPVKSGAFQETMQGQGVATSGPLSGRLFAFKATVLGNEVTNATRIRFTLK